MSAFSASRNGAASASPLESPYALPLLLAAAWLLPAGPFTAIGAGLLLLYIATGTQAVNSAGFRLVLPFLAMAAWGAFMGLGNDRYDVAKDLWYAIKLCICLMLGFSLGARTADSRRPLDAFVWFALASALWSIATWRQSAGESLDTVGLEGFEHLSLASVVALPLLAWGVIRDRGPRRLIQAALGLLLLFAIVISASRTTIIAAGVMALAALGLFSSWRRWVVAALLIGAVAYLAYLFLPTYSGGPLTLAVKFRRSLDEIFLTDNIDAKEMILNWRGFEAYNAQLLFDQSSFFQKLFGNGTGTTVDIGLEIYAADGTFTRFLPTLHNGYYYLLIKYGVLGVLTYIGTLFWFAMVGRRTADASAQEDRLLLGVIVAVLFATLVITGLYNKSALQDMTILLGWLIGQGCRARFDSNRAYHAGSVPVRLDGAA